jgi:hypothetical protein
MAKLKLNPHDGETLWLALQADGHIGYGNDIPVSYIHEHLGLVMPEIGKRRDFERVQLLEMTAVEYVRKQLLEQGMWITRQGNQYHIPLPSENSHYATNMLSSAARKIKRAGRLVSNTPTCNQPPDQTASRVLLLQDSVKAARKRRDQMK